MVRSLTPNDRRDLQSIHARLQAGDTAAALARLDALPPEIRDHPDGMFLRALILQSLGRFDDACAIYDQALAIVPDHAMILNSYGNLLDDLGEGDKAVESLRRATELQPENNDFHINLGIAAIGADRLDIAEQALARAIRAAPKVARSWAALGLLERKRGNTDTAAQVYRRAIELDSEDVRTRHNLAALLAEEDRPGEALEEAENALRLGPVPPETAMLRAHLLADVGRLEEAASEYWSIGTQVPDHLEAHRALALLMPQIGREGAALDGFRAALRARPDSQSVWNAALQTAMEIGDFVQLAAWAQEAETLAGLAAQARLMRAVALSRLGNPRSAIPLLEDVVRKRPDHPAAHQYLAESLMAIGDPKAAEAHALRGTEIDPLDQMPWALLTVIWRMLEDPREAWLADYERLVMTVDLDAAPGFFDELGERLIEWHMTTDHPAHRSARVGTQTRGNLFDRRDPLVERLVAQIRAGVRQQLRTLPEDSAHPFLSRKETGVAFADSWSVRLRGGGFHVDHVHPRGWLSSTLYVSLPPEVGQGEAGALAFGVADPAFKLDLAPRRIVAPRAGQLVLFPSYFWHGTLPFQSDKPRLTVSFDALPSC